MSISKKTLRYKDFEGSIEVDIDDNLLYGQILFINDVITYEGDNICELKKAFKNMVDEYIKYCEELGVKPQKTYSGSFNIRPGADMHRKLVQEAELNGKTLNQLIKNIFEEYFTKKETSELPLSSNQVFSNSYIQGDLPGYIATTYSWAPTPKEIYFPGSRTYSPQNVRLNKIINNLKNRIK